MSNGLYITNTSMANLMKLLPKVPFLLDDSVSRSNRLDAYFKEIYKNRVLCEVHAITMEQYRQSIEDTLRGFDTGAHQRTGICEKSSRYDKIPSDRSAAS